MDRNGSLSLVFLLICAAQFLTTDGDIQLDSLKHRNVIITHPSNVTIFLVTEDKLIVAWSMPPIFVPHDVSINPFVDVKSGKKIHGIESKIPMAPTKVDTSNATTADNTTTDVDNVNGTVSMTNSSSSTTEEKMMKDEATSTADQAVGSQTTGDASSSGKASPDSSLKVEATPVNLTPVVCRPLSEFANYTVGEKKTVGVDDNDWATSMLESNVLVIQGFLYFKEKIHQVVPFEKGCVTKFVVSYSKDDGRSPVTEMVLNATDRLATIEGLKEVTKYKIVVTAHYVSGHELSAAPVFVSTLMKGQPQICQCDWHGTANHTESCESPSSSDQVCNCFRAYADRFCSVCADGFYRDKLGHGCKRCPCDEHGTVQSSCQFVEGFLHCDQCGEGYTGNVCHRCANGYFRYGNQCKRCYCNGNTHPDAKRMCHPSTGSCIDCLHNSTGYFCERCQSGYVHHPDKDNNSCIKMAEAVDHSGSSSDSISPGIIGSLIFVSLICFGMLVGFVLYRRMRARRQRALWTVEMRPDNDDLDFNSVPNEDAHMEDVDDMQFYETGGRSGGGKTSGKYSKLTEEC